MSSLMTRPFNGHMQPDLSSWVKDWLGLDSNAPFTSNFNQGMTLPAVNIRETGEAYFVEMAVPGMKKSDFKVEIDNETLVIASEGETQKQEGDYSRKEFGYAQFRRSFHLPDSVEDNKIKAKYENGLLMIEIPKKEEARRKPPRRISLK